MLLLYLINAIIITYFSCVVILVINAWRTLRELNDFSWRNLLGKYIRLSRFVYSFYWSIRHFFVLSSFLSSWLLCVLCECAVKYCCHSVDCAVSNCRGLYFLNGSNWMQNEMNYKLIVCDKWIDDCWRFIIGDDDIDRKWKKPKKKKCLSNLILHILGIRNETHTHSHWHCTLSMWVR